MPTARPTPHQQPGSDGRTATERSRDHAAIERLARDLLPALVAKLGAGGLGELEVREGEWRIRLRRPAPQGNTSRRATDRPSRAQPGHEGHGHAAGSFDAHRGSGSRSAGSAGASSAGVPSAGAASTNGATPASGAGLAPVGPGHGGPDEQHDRRSESSSSPRATATSPAVGIFQPGSGATPGTRVAAGDRLGIVDMLGVPQELLSPAAGIVGARLAEAGDAVEYGQELVRIEFLTTPAGATAGPAPRPASTEPDGAA